MKNYELKSYGAAQKCFIEALMLYHTVESTCTLHKRMSVLHYVVNDL